MARHHELQNDIYDITHHRHRKCVGQKDVKCTARAQILLDQDYKKSCEINAQSHIGAQFVVGEHQTCIQGCRHEKDKCEIDANAVLGQAFCHQDTNCSTECLKTSPDTRAGVDQRELLSVFKRL